MLLLQMGVCAPPSELSMTGKPAETLLKDISGSREGTCSTSTLVPLHTRQTVWSPAESGARVALTSACRLHAEILDVFAAKCPAVSGSTASPAMQCTDPSHAGTGEETAAAHS